MAQTNFNIGTIPNDGTGLPLREAFQEQELMNTELYAAKVDKITGKDLSSNDFTDADRIKLDGIDIGAQVNIQADCLQNDSTKPDYIKNFPLIIDNNNRFTEITGYSLVGQDLTLAKDWAWLIYGSAFTNPAEITINIPVCDTGMQRIDYIVPNIYNGFERVVGIEVPINPIAPILPNGGIFATYMLVSDSDIVTITSTVSPYPIFGEWTLIRHASGNTGSNIQMNDFAHGQYDSDNYCNFGRYKNYTSDGNVHNPLNYELLLTVGLTSI